MATSKDVINMTLSKGSGVTLLTFLLLTLDRTGADVDLLDKLIDLMGVLINVAAR